MELQLGVNTLNYSLLYGLQLKPDARSVSIHRLFIHSAKEKQIKTFISWNPLIRRRRRPSFPILKVVAFLDHVFEELDWKSREGGVYWTVNAFRE